MRIARRLGIFGQVLALSTVAFVCFTHIGSLNTALLGISASATIFTTAAFAIITRTNNSAAKPGTLLKIRTVEDIERQVGFLHEQNRKLRANYQEASAANRDQKRLIDERDVSRNVLLTGLQAGEPDVQYTRILRIVSETLCASGAALWLADTANELLEIGSTFGYISPVTIAESISFAANDLPGSIRQICKNRLRSAIQRQPGMDSPLPTSPGFDENALVGILPDERPDVLACVLRHGEVIVGAVAFGGPARGRFEETDSQRLGSLTADIATAISSLQRSVHLKRQCQELNALHEIDNLLHGATRSDDLYRQVLDQISTLVPFENCTVFGLDSAKNSLIHRATRGRRINLLDHIAFERGSGISGWVAEQRKQFFVRDLLSESGLQDAEMVPQRVRSFISVPMVVDDRVVGVLNASHSKPRAFTPEDARLLTLCATRAAVALERGAR